MDPYYAKYKKYNTKYKKYRLNMIGGSSDKKDEEPTYIDNIKRQFKDLKKRLKEKKDLVIKEQTIINIYKEIKNLSNLNITLQEDYNKVENKIRILYREKKSKEKQIKPPSFFKPHSFLKSKKQKKNEENLRKDIEDIDKQIISERFNLKKNIDRNIILNILKLTDSINELSKYGDDLKAISEDSIKFLKKNNLDKYSRSINQIKNSTTILNILKQTKIINIHIIKQILNIFLTLDHYTDNEYIAPYSDPSDRFFFDFNAEQQIDDYHKKQKTEIKRLEKEFNIIFPIIKHESRKDIEIYTISLPPTIPENKPLIIKGDYLKSHPQINTI